MIYDSITNIETYAVISDDIRTGLDFLRDAKSDLSNGICQFSTNIKMFFSTFIEGCRDYANLLPMTIGIK